LSLTTKQLVIHIDNRVNQILASGGDEKLLISLYDIMGDLKNIMDSSSSQELDAYCQQYNGFFHAMKLLENMAAGIAAGSIILDEDEDDNEKTKSEDVFSELQTIMANALVQMKTLIKNDVTKEINFVSMASLFITGLMSTAADLSELAIPGSAAYLYSEVEAAAKNGGFSAVKGFLKKAGNSYSVSNIAPDDMTTAMNYLGQELGAALYKHFHELPKPLRTEEMLLRGIEALAGNLLYQKFNSPKDPHVILDQLCEHVHMVLDDLTERDQISQQVFKGN
jgi:hypothetical protein